MNPQIPESFPPGSCECDRRSERADRRIREGNEAFQNSASPGPWNKAIDLLETRCFILGPQPAISGGQGRFAKARNPRHRLARLARQEKACMSTERVLWRQPENNGHGVNIIIISIKATVEMVMVRIK